MNSEAYVRVRELFLEANRLPLDELPRFLEATCGGDAVLRAELERLLAHDRQPLAFGDTGAAGYGAELLARAIGEEARSDGAALPRRIGRYRLLGVLGEGGMGVVYEAEQDEPRRRVAIKVIRPGLGTPDLMRRLRREARVLGQLNHPGIARIYEAATASESEGGMAYLAMELVRGSTITKYAEKRRLGVRGRLELVESIAAALHHAHQRGVVHRDLKPENIVVDEETDSGVEPRDQLARPKILDFGVARLTDSDARAATLQTVAGRVIGTIPYMSPEQASGDPARVDVRSDVYALGVIAFELLTGRLPCAVAGKEIHEAVRVIREEEPPRLGSVIRTLRGDVETIVAKALEKEPERRYQSAAELAADIRRYLDDQTIEARPASIGYRISKFARRNRALAASAAIAFAAMAVATVLSLWQSRLARHAESEANAQRVLSDSRADALAAQSWQSYRAVVEWAQSAMHSGDVLGAARFLSVAATEERGFGYRYLEARLDRSVASIRLDPPALAAALLGDGSGLVTVDASGAVRRFRLDGTEVLPPRPLGAPLAGPAAFDESGRYLAAGLEAERPTLALWDLADGRRIAATELTKPKRRAALRRVAVTRDGAHVALAGASNLLWSPLRDPPVIRLEGQRPTAHAFSRDGRRLIGAALSRSPGDGRRLLHEFDVNGRKLAAFDSGISSTSSEITSVAALSEGDSVLFGASDGRIELVDMGKRRSLRVFHAGTAGITALALDPSEQTFAAGSADGSIRVFGLDASESRAEFMALGQPVTGLGFSSGGSLLASCEGERVRVHDLRPPDDAAEVLRGHQSYVYGVAFDGTGSRVYSVGWDGDLRVWDAASRQPLAAIKTHSSRLRGLAVARDAPLLAIGHEGGRVSIWSTLSGTLQANLRTRKRERVVALDILGDGSRVAARTGRVVTVWDLPSGAEALRVRAAGTAESKHGLVFTPDGGSLLVGSGQDLVRLDAHDGRTLQRLVGGRGQIQCVAVGADGTLAAAGTGRGVTVVWNLRTGELVHALEDQVQMVHALAFSPDGKRLAAGCDNRTVVLWNPWRGDKVLRLEGHTEYVFALAFSPDGSRLVSGSGDHTVRVWDTHPDRERVLASKRAAALREEAEPLVDRLFSERGSASAVAAAVSNDPDLEIGIREAALGLVLQRVADGAVR